MAGKKENPLIGAFRAPVPDASPPDKTGEDKNKGQTQTVIDPKATGIAAPTKADEGKKPAEPPKDAAPAKADEGKKPAEPSKDTSLRFVPLSKIHDLPGTYVKDQPRADYGDMVKSIKAEGLKEPIILRQREDGEYQLVDGFHRMQAVKQAGMLEIRADVYEMKQKDAMDYRKTRNTVKGLPIPGTLIPPTKAAEPSQDDRPPWEEKPAEGKAAETSEKPAAGEDEIPQDFTLPITKEGQSEIITTMKIADIHPFEGHPFYVKDDKDMDDLVDSVKKFGVLEPAVVIPRKAGGFEMISGHRRRRACELAGIATMPVIVRQLDRDEATISMVDANLKRENISPIEKARAYKMKLEAMKHKAGRRTKEEKAALEAAGKKPMRADEELAQQTGESRANIQKIVRLNDLTPELQQMVEEKKLPVHTASDLSYLKKEEQAAVADAIKKEDKVPSGTQAAELKKQSQAGTLTTEKIEKAVAPTKREENPPLKLTLTEEELRPYFPDKRTTIPDAKRGVLEALDLRKKAIERREAQKSQGDKGPPKKKPGPAR